MSKKNDWILINNTYYKSVKGFVFDGRDFTPIDVSVRITYDKHGKTLRLSDDLTLQYSIGLEDIEDILREALDYDR